MLHISSIHATCQAAPDIIYSLHNPAPASPLLKLGNGHKEPIRNIQKSKSLSSTSEGASQGGSTKETTRSEPGRKPNENCTAIKSNHQCRTFEGAYCRGIPR